MYVEFVVRITYVAINYFPTCNFLVSFNYLINILNRNHRNNVSKIRKNSLEIEIKHFAWWKSHGFQIYRVFIIIIVYSTKYFTQYRCLRNDI